MTEKELRKTAREVAKITFLASAENAYTYDDVRLSNALRLFDNAKYKRDSEPLMVPEFRRAFWAAARAFYMLSGRTKHTVEYRQIAAKIRRKKQEIKSWN